MVSSNQPITLIFVPTNPEGNIHINVISENWSKEVEDLLEPFIYELVGT